MSFLSKIQLRACYSSLLGLYYMLMLLVMASELRQEMILHTEAHPMLMFDSQKHDTGIT